MSADANTARRVRFFPNIVEECLDDADFLWTRWEHFLDAPDLGIEKVYFWVEQRLQGALDGLRTGDLSLLEAALASDSQGAISAAAHVLASSRDPAAFELLARAFTSFEGATLTSIRRGIEVTADNKLFEKLGHAALSGSPSCRAAWLDMHTACGLDPGVLLPQLLRAAEPQVRAAALRASRHAPAIPSPELLRWLTAPEPAVIAAAIEAALARNLPEAWRACFDLCARPDASEHARPLLPILAMSGDPRAVQLLQSAAELDSLCRDAVFALGASGRVAAADSCIGAMRSGRVIRTAADAFCKITGLKLAEAELIATAPASEPPSLQDDDLDADLRPQVDDVLPEPDVAGVEAWWKAHKSAFDLDGRYLDGKGLGLMELHSALRHGPARWRHTRALELALRSGGSAHVSTRGFARTQRRQLEAIETLNPKQLTRIQGWAPLY